LKIECNGLSPKNLRAKAVVERIFPKRENGLYGIFEKRACNKGVNPIKKPV
jgi:hypothetical protein